MEIEINIVGWWTVWMDYAVPIAVFSMKSDAERFIENESKTSSLKYSIYLISAKTDFTDEQIKNELSKRCAQIEMTHCGSNL